MTSRAVLEPGTLDLDMVGERALALEVTGRDAAIQELALGFAGLAAFNGDDVMLDGDRDFIGRETRDRQRDLVAVFGEPFDVVGWVRARTLAL
jgi:hypothetical protein